MTKVRLTMDMRNRIMAIADKSMVLTKEKAAVDKAYEKCAPLVRKTVEARYPVSDMAVLKKYDKTKVDDYITLQLTSGGAVQFTFNDGEGVLVASGYNSRIYAADEKLTKAFEAWRDAVDQLDSARLNKEKDYRALIFGSKTLEEIEEIFPAASQIRASIGKNLPATINGDVLARISEDVRLQKKAAA